MAAMAVVEVLAVAGRAIVETEATVTASGACAGLAWPLWTKQVEGM